MDINPNGRLWVACMSIVRLLLVEKRLPRRGKKSFRSRDLLHNKRDLFELLIKFSIPQVYLTGFPQEAS